MKIVYNMIKHFYMKYHLKKIKLKYYLFLKIKVI